MNSQSEHDLHAAITVAGQIEKDIHRLTVERVAEVVDAFRGTILKLFEELQQQIDQRFARVDAELADIRRAIEARQGDGNG